MLLHCTSSGVVVSAMNIQQIHQILHSIVLFCCIVISLFAIRSGFSTFTLKMPQVSRLPAVTVPLTCGFCVSRLFLPNHIQSGLHAFQAAHSSISTVYNHHHRCHRLTGVAAAKRARQAAITQHKAQVTPSLIYTKCVT